MPDGRILIADDEDSLRWVLEKGFRGAGYQVTAVKDGTAAFAQIETGPFDLILLDVRKPGMDGLTLLKRTRELRPDAQIVIMTAHGTMETAIQAMQQGAYDYLAKPFDLDEALLLAERAMTAQRLTQEVSSLRTGLKEVWEFGALVGRHPTMQEVYKAIGRIAASDVSVLLRGESGTGKEVVARALHHYSRRAGRPFVGISAAAIPVTLLESELFGHEKGAFTDAKDRRLGKLELAHSGTVFFDEIGDMPPELQVKLLRARGWSRADPHGRARARRHASRSRGDDARGPLPGGSLLPPQRGHAVPAVAARAAGRHPAAGRAHARQVRRVPRRARDRRGRPRPPRRLCLAGQRKRTS